MAKPKIKGVKINESVGDRVFNIITSILLIFVILLIGYPCVYIISCSFSSTTALQAGKVILWPVDFTLNGYQFILDFKQVWVGYRNSIFYTFFGTLISMAMCVLAAYPLSRKTFQGGSIYMKLFYFTTLFNAGMIPTFILETSLGFFDTVWPTLLFAAVVVSHIIILRTAFATSIPGDLFDAAKIDGASDFQCLFKIALPLAKATMSVLVLYCIVTYWNEYFTSMIYLRNDDLLPLQLVLRPIMTEINSSMNMNGMSTTSQAIASQGLDQVRYGLIVVATVPALAAYLVVQKYFKGGVMVGSVKG